MTDKEDLTMPFYAAVGGADLALERLNEIVGALRERADEAGSEVSTRAQETRDKLTKLAEETSSEVTSRTKEAREKLTKLVEDASSELSSRAQETRDRLTKFQDDLPKLRQDLRAKLTSEELRKTAESYRDQATEVYQNLAERGEAALERLRHQPKLEERFSAAANLIGRGSKTSDEAETVIEAAPAEETTPIFVEPAPAE
jgi:heparin binding hemagglutinin HbhA